MKNKIIRRFNILMWILVFYVIGVSQNLEFLRLVAMVSSMFIFAMTIIAAYKSNERTD